MSYELNNIKELNLRTISCDDEKEKEEDKSVETLV